MEARHLITTHDHDDELTRVVARIRARGSDMPLPTPPAKAVASVIAHLRDEEPLSAADLADHERLWRVGEDETRTREHDNDHAEGLL